MISCMKLFVLKKTNDINQTPMTYTPAEEIKGLQSTSLVTISCIYKRQWHMIHVAENSNSVCLECTFWEHTNGSQKSDKREFKCLVNAKFMVDENSKAEVPCH